MATREFLSSIEVQASGVDACLSHGYNLILHCSTWGLPGISELSLGDVLLAVMLRHSLDLLLTHFDEQIFCFVGGYHLLELAFKGARFGEDIGAVPSGGVYVRVRSGEGVHGEQRTGEPR